MISSGLGITEGSARQRFFDKAALRYGLPSPLDLLPPSFAPSLQLVQVVFTIVPRIIPLVLFDFEVSDITS